MEMIGASWTAVARARKLSERRFLESMVDYLG